MRAHLSLKPAPSDVMSTSMTPIPGLSTNTWRCQWHYPRYPLLISHLGAATSQDQLCTCCSPWPHKDQAVPLASHTLWGIAGSCWFAHAGVSKEEWELAVVAEVALSVCPPCPSWCLPQICVPWAMCKLKVDSGFVTLCNTVILLLVNVHI